ncbi:putative metal tolerance protein 3 [Sphaerosporella brunnea]|uniref:Putative metal tolerance protein 3 n=1 Tax=Sphaerosporella brunnea TaxID=1250544 RepID=A0A5J5EDI2_9PEZI|nr:putative metal tolerance protein 3 [Sphaerosporella brunnea]
MSTIITTTPIELTDVETSPRLVPHDPYQLSSALKSPAEIESLAESGTHSRLPFSARLRRSSGGEKRDIKGLKTFYETQNAHIQRMLKSVDEHRREAKDSAEDTRLRFLIAVHGSLAANVILAVLQLYAAISSESLSLFATAADSIFDPMSNVLLILSHRAVQKVDSARFPSGKARIETAGNIAFAFMMIAVSMILLVMSARDIATTSHDELKRFHLPSVIAVSVALSTKLLLFFYCYSLKDKYSQVMILWKDHRNDLPVNSFGLFTSIAGSKLAWWVDPMGAVVIALIIMVAWGRVIYQESLLLIGVTAPQELRGLITYISMTHDDRITHIDTVRAYHSGPRIIVEVDIVMPETSTLRETHDVAESLQIKLEDLPDVERAYVHVDYETEHRPEHFLKKEL